MSSKKPYVRKKTVRWMKLPKRGQFAFTKIYANIEEIWRHTVIAIKTIDRWRFKVSRRVTKCHRIYKMEAKNRKWNSRSRFGRFTWGKWESLQFSSRDGQFRGSVPTEGLDTGSFWNFESPLNYWGWSSSRNGRARLSYARQIETLRWGVPLKINA